jgi:ATP-dependent RNA helicase RhlE
MKDPELTICFSDLHLSEPLLRALATQNYAVPTPIQTRAIPPVMAGRDVLALAQTGTGKTAAFALPILHRLAAEPSLRLPRALILVPTRELAIQVGESFRTYGRHSKLRIGVVFGGVSQKPQADALARGLDILVATPGRLRDLQAQSLVHFDHLKVLVLDEADRMLDMGFLPDVRKIIAALPSRRQTLLFSATMPEGIARLAASILNDPVRVEVAPSATTVDRIDQRVIFVPTAQKPSVLAGLLRDPTVSRALVFARTKHGANRIAMRLSGAAIEAEAIHGNKSQSARQRALSAFREGRVRVLVATDIAARGIDVEAVSHVINFDVPNEAESYVHRIGRTARAGASGIAVSLCDGSERAFLAAIEKITRHRLQVIDEPRSAMLSEAPPLKAQPSPPVRPRRKRWSGRHSVQRSRTRAAHDSSMRSVQ